MKYRNRVTGNVIDVPCELNGPDWETVNDSAQRPEKPGRKPKTRTKAEK